MSKKFRSLTLKILSLVSEKVLLQEYWSIDVENKVTIFLLKTYGCFHRFTREIYKVSQDKIFLLISENEFYSRIRNIVNDRIHGSTTIAVNLLTFLSDTLRDVEISEAIRYLDKVLRITKERSSIVLTTNLLCILRKSIELSSTIEERTDVWRIARLLLSSYNQDTAKAVENAVNVLKDYRKLFTLSYSSQVLRILEKVPCVEASTIAGWPLLDGLRTLRELKSRRLKVRIYPDSSIYEAISSSEAVVLGCDTVLLDGSAVNRSSSKTAALICGEVSVPLYIVCDTMKLDFQSIWSPEEWEYMFEEEKMYFRVFEKIEPIYVSSYIYDLGVDDPKDFVEKALNKIKEYPYKLIHQ